MVQAPGSYVSEFGVILNERPRAQLSHLHKTRPNYLHIRAFCIYSEQTRSRQIFEHPSVPYCYRHIRELNCQFRHRLFLGENKLDFP